MAIGGVNGQPCQNIRYWQERSEFSFSSAIGFSIPRIGVTSTITIMIIAPLIAGLVLDHFGWLGVLQYSINFYLSFPFF